MSLKQSISDFKDLAESLKSILELSNELEKVGDIEALILKSTQEVNAAKRCELDAKASMSVALKAVADAELQAKELLSNAEKRSASIMSGANLQASIDLKAARDSVSKLAEQKAKADLELASVKKDIEDKKKELASIQGEIQGVKSKLSAFMRH